MKISGHLIDLTAKEFKVLHRMMQNPERVVTREQLENTLYAWGDEIESNAIEVFIYPTKKNRIGIYQNHSRFRISNE